jgi:hypothetical protein
MAVYSRYVYHSLRQGERRGECNQRSLQRYLIRFHLVQYVGIQTCLPVDCPGIHIN